ncbi:MAG: hypothetical protein ACRC6B_07580, partial [Fusobacteriaceae bacterium]
NGVGILGNNGSKVTNEELGTIIGTGKGEILADENGIVLSDIGGSTGIKVNNNSEAINYGKIEMSGAWTRGMQANNQSNIVNKGTINLNSELQYISEWYEDDGEMEYDKGLVFTKERGMVANTGSIAVNNGEINAYGSAVGMESRNESKAYNNGDIYIEGKIEETQENILSGWYDENYVVSNSRGMLAEDNSKVFNEKNIEILGSGTGIVAFKNSYGENSETGNIYMESIPFIQEYTWTDQNGNIINEKEIELTHLEGMSGVNNSKIVNKGNIELAGLGSGMFAGIGSTATNNGTISNQILDVEIDGVSGASESIRGMQIAANSSGINNNLIALVGNENSYLAGAHIYDGSTFENSVTGKIEIEGDSVTGISGYSDENSEFQNETIINNVGDISVSGITNAYGINSNGIEKVINTGTISVEKIENSENYYNSFAGIQASGKQNYDENGQLLQTEKTEVINNGTISIKGDKGVGIFVQNGDLMNDGEILLEGQNMTALSINGSGNLINTSDLELNGTGIKAYAYNYNNVQEKVTVENEGKITVTGDAKIEKQPGSDYYNAFNAAIGIESSGGDIYNSGDIIAKGDGAYLEYET